MLERRVVMETHAWRRIREETRVMVTRELMTSFLRLEAMRGSPQALGSTIPELEHQDSSPWPQVCTVELEDSSSS